jgi:hypothetical protein
MEGHAKLPLFELTVEHALNLLRETDVKLSVILERRCAVPESGFDAVLATGKTPVTIYCRT